MRAVVADSSAPGRIALQDVPEPVAAPGEVLVDVRAFSINRGEMRMLGTATDGWRPGWDFAGILRSDVEHGLRAGARRTGDDHQLALADLHVDVEQHVDPLRPLAVVVMDVDRLDDRGPQDLAIHQRHSNSMIGSTFHRRRIANRLDTAVMTRQAINATTISRRPMVMPRWIVVSAPA